MLPTAAAKRIAERVASALVIAKVDREAGVIRNVKLCGRASENGRDYLLKAFAENIRKYEGVPIYCNHSEGQRCIEDKFGWVTNPTIGPDACPYGDANFLKAHPMYARTMEAAERNPALLGFSHVAMCHTSLRDGRECVEGIERIESCDLVAEPATTQGLFESKGSRVFKIKQLVVWVAKHPKSTVEQIAKIKKLAEDDSMYADADLGGAGDAGPAEDVDPDDAISSGFEAALMAVVRKALSGDMDPKAALQKIKTLLAAHCDATDSGGGDDEGDDEGGDDAADADKPASEGKRKGNAIAEAMTLCDKLKFRPDGTDLNIIAGSPKDLRERIVERLKKGAESGGGERSKSNGRHQTAILEEQAAAGKPPEGGKDFAKWVTE